ncbi:transcription factor HES-5-like [Pholidichthys leucotaenia]
MATVTQSRAGDRPVDSSGYKLRKLQVEKARRDRINHSIEQLRVLLVPGEPGGEQPSCRLEKADVLEMAVRFLRQRAVAPAGVAAPSYSQGFSQCLQETLRHLSLHVHLQRREREEIKRFYVRQRAVLQRRPLKRKDRRTGSRKSPATWSSVRPRVHLWRPW